MDNQEIDKVIREIKDHTNWECARDKNSFAPVAALAAIAILNDMRGG